MIAFFTTVVTDFQGLCGMAEAAVAGVWAFFVSVPATIVSVF